jgi:hypothetical protein
VLLQEEPAQRPGDGEGDVGVGDVGEDVQDEALTQQRRALALAARAEVAGLAGERDQAGVAAGAAARPGEARLHASTLEVGLEGPAHMPGSGPGIEALLAHLQVALEKLLDEAVERRLLRPPRAVAGRGLADERRRRGDAPRGVRR